MPASSAASMTVAPSRASMVLPLISILTMSRFRPLHHAALVFDVVLELLAEVLQEAAHRHGRRIAEGADGVPLDLAGHVVELVEILRRAVTVLDAMHHARQPA